MDSKAPKPALFEAPLKVDSVGSDDAFGRLVACAALEGLSIEATAEKAAVTELAAITGLTYDESLELLRGLKKRSSQD